MKRIIIASVFLASCGSNVVTDVAKVSNTCDTSACKVSAKDSVSTANVSGGVSAKDSAKTLKK